MSATRYCPPGGAIVGLGRSRSRCSSRRFPDAVKATAASRARHRHPLRPPWFPHRLPNHRPSSQKTRRRTALGVHSFPSPAIAHARPSGRGGSHHGTLHVGHRGGLRHARRARRTPRRVVGRADRRTVAGRRCRADVPVDAVCAQARARSLCYTLEPWTSSPGARGHWRGADLYEPA